MFRPIAAVFLLALSAAVTALLLPSDGPMLPQRGDLHMYLVMLDRFADGDASNNDANGMSDASNPLAVQGGDLRGLEERLPYLRALGVNAVWLTPVQQNVPGAFHGYWIQHFLRVDPRLGSMEDLRRVIRRAHALGIRVYLDVVCNHTGPLIGTAEGGHEWNPDGYTLEWNDPDQLPTPAALQDLSLYHPYGEVLKWEAPYQVVGELPGGLDDLRTEDPRVLAIMIDIWTWWMEQTGCDGFRVDTVKHVDMPFWYAWLQAMRRHARALGKKDFFIFGEVFSSEDAFNATYTLPAGDGRRGFDAVFNFSLAEGLRDALGRDGSLRLLRTSLRSRHLYDSTALPYMLNFIDNHDVDRFLSLPRADTARLLHALTFLYGMQGIPLLYYGTEQAFPGGTGHDWKNRESMFARGWKGDAPPGDSYDTTGRVFRWIAALQQLRERHPVLRRGTVRLLHADTVRGVIAVERVLGARHAFVLLNSADAPAALTLSSAQPMRAWPDTPLKRDGQELHVTLPPASALLLLPRKASLPREGSLP